MPGILGLRIGAVILAAGLLASPSAHALDWTVRLEPGAAFNLTAPQTDYFGPGGGLGIRAGLSPIRVLDVHLASNLLWFSGKNGGDTGAAYAVGGGARFIWRSDWLVAPWIDGDLFYVRTGDANRFSFDLGVGAAFRLEKTRLVWLGPYLRYMQIVTQAMTNTDSADAKILIVGVSLELRTPQRRPPADRDHDGVLDPDDKCPDEPGLASNQGCPIADSDGDGIPDGEDRCPSLPGPRATGGCPDSDHDGIADADDKCPLAQGTSDNNGCPRYKQIVVKSEKIELSEKVFFAFNKVDILPKSFPILDEVVQALKDYPAIRVRIEGHTDDIGSAAYNQQLSEGRANAVRSYLVDHGIAPERLTSKGYGADLPLDTNKTSEGRERNRRVEFVIEQR